MIITIYEKNTGKIKRSITLPEFMINVQIQENETYIETDIHYFNKNHYINIFSEIPVLTIKPEIKIEFDKEQIIANDIDMTTIKNLPNDCIIMINDISYNVIDNIFQLTVSLPGIYNIKIIKFPYITKEVQIEGIL